MHLLKGVQSQILRHPEKYDQGTFGYSCQTAYCIAGHLCMAVDGRISEQTWLRASAILGLPLTMSAGLFRPSVEMANKSEIFGGLFHNPDDASRAAAGAKHIDDFIKANT